MAFRTAEEQLRDQFYEWETLGGGWAAWERRVRLEPPFRPFFTHSYTFDAAPDDGRRHTFLSRAFDALRGRSTETTALAVQEKEPLPLLPRYLDRDPGTVSYIAHVPRDRVIRPDLMSACLLATRAARYPIAFELVGGFGETAVQFVVRKPDEPILLAALKNHFPEVTLAPGDLLSRVFGRDDFGVMGVFELGLKREFMLPIAASRGFDPDPLIAFVAALEETTEEEGGAL